jgi:molybdopterin adenylyltransferase
VGCEVLPDDVDQIRQRLESWTDGEDCDAIFTTGGTGLAPRDVTPEATRAMLEKEVPGLAELMRAEGLKSTPMAALSRGVAGVRKGKLIVNLPGSVRGARESLESILGLLQHAVDIAQGRTEHREGS